VGAAQAGLGSAEAKVQQALAERQAAAARVAQARAGVQTALADAAAAGAQTGASMAKVGVAQADVRQAAAAVTEARTILGYTDIRASNGGVVTARLVAPGVLVQPGMAILRVAKLDFVRLQANVAAPDAVALREGQPVAAFTVDDPRPVVSDRVSRVFPVSDPMARTTVVEARVRNPAGALRPGQPVILEIELGGSGEPVVSVPNRALLTRAGDNSVFVVVTEGTLKRAKQLRVKPGAMSRGRTVILSGLPDRAEVIVQGVDNLSDGDRVEVMR
jgi:RND family efflux transporter MFP subunit